MPLELVAVSGVPLRDRAVEVLRALNETLGKKTVLVSVGGVRTCGGCRATAEGWGHLGASVYWIHLRRTFFGAADFKSATCWHFAGATRICVIGVLASTSTQKF